MKVSIIIVSYNVKYFLEQCLCSVKKAIREWSAVNAGLQSEVYVVDNNSSDGTITYLQPLFPFVKFIENSVNTGFAKANNQALRLAKGQYVLFLNPDTILPEDFLVACLTHMDNHQKIGAVGVQMIDGTGKYLNESKRGFPSTWVSFCKMSGLTALFPHSEIFANYYMGHLDRDCSHEVDALSGACTIIRRQALDLIGGFDERFFMYAEDIDLSYRVQKAGYINYYLADATIIHFKGESTRKDMHYIKLFYQAMIQFVQKHYSGSTRQLYAHVLKTAIRGRATIAMIGLAFKRNLPNEQPGTRKIFLKGDHQSMEQVRSLLTDPLRTQFVQSASDDAEIILCEGKYFSFKEMIAAMKKLPRPGYKVHAMDSHSIAGEHASEGSGKGYEATATIY